MIVDLCADCRKPYEVPLGRQYPFLVGKAELGVIVEPLGGRKAGGATPVGTSGSRSPWGWADFGRRARRSSV